MLLDKCLKSHFSQYPSTSNMVKGSKHYSNLDGWAFIIFFITAKETEFEKVSLSDMQNLKIVC